MGFVGARIEVTPCPGMRLAVGDHIGTAHGVGRVAGIERYKVVGVEVELYRIDLPPCPPPRSGDRI
jgi:hypothetical protein